MVAKPKVKAPRTVIDRKKLVANLAAIAEHADVAKPDVRQQILGLFREALEGGRAEIQRRFEKREADGAETYAAGSYLLDQITLTLFEFSTTSVFPPKPDAKAEVATTETAMAVVATGGYGRAEIAPHSDIDLMFLFNRKPVRQSEKVVEWMLYMLWDLGLKVGHATRSVGEAMKTAKEDHTIRTSMLDARMVAGDLDVYQKFEARFRREMLGAKQTDFVKAKLDERDQRHERMGDSRYVLEPNIKDGKGGLRDLQTLYWIAKAIYHISDISELVSKGAFERSDANRFAKAQQFLWAVRCHLHFTAGRPEEILSFNVQGDLAKRMGYRNRASSSGVERFMKHYFLVAKDVGDLTRVLCAVLEEQHAKKSKIGLPSLPFRKGKASGFKIDAGRLTVEKPAVFSKDPINLLRLFSEAERFDVDIHPEALRLTYKNLKRIDSNVRKDAEANRLFLGMLCNPKGPELTLRRLNEAGVIGQLIPDFGRVVGQMQYDMYHVFTVDEHTIHAIGILSQIERGLLADDHPLSTSEIKEVQSRRVLYVAVLLHDIAKGRGGDHSELGAEIAQKLCPRFGLDEWETETVQWLVLHHLDMSRIAFKRDIDDPQTVKDFVEKVQSLERLRLLLILTVADIRAVGPNVWNGWKAALLRDLYYRAREAMSGKSPGGRAQARAADIKDKLSERLKGWSAEEIKNHFELGYTDYWLGFDLDHLERHAKLIKKAEGNKSDLRVATNTDSANDITEVVVYTADHPGLFARIAGALALVGASIVDARVVTLSNGMALDTFWVQDVGGGAYSGLERLRRLEDKIRQALTGQLNPKVELEKERARMSGSRTHVFKVPPRVTVDNRASATATVIEVNGRDRSGFLHDITWALTGLSLQINSAHVTTYGERAVDVFYVKDVFGLKVDQASKIKNIEEKLLTVITPPPA